MASRARLIFALVLSAIGSANSDIENLTCELAPSGVYRFNYVASPGAVAVEVFASSRPDRINSAEPVLTIHHTPAEVSLPGRQGRVYFHLKPAGRATRVVSVRRLPLEGAKNFRDLGGYRASDGRYVRWGMVYRSNHLVHLTAGDYEYIGGLGIRLVCDLRTEREKLRSPTLWMGHTPEFLSVPVGRDQDTTVTAEESLKRRLAAMSVEDNHASHGYDQYAIEYAPQYGIVLRRLVAGDLPAIVHCSGGKDRTGVFSAILLTALGIPRETVIQDYLLTSRYALAADSLDRTAVDLKRILGLPQLPAPLVVQAIMTTKPEKLEATFDTIISTFGSFDNYLRNGLQISEADLAVLRERLLEP